jgi:hypothetical protein
MNKVPFTKPSTTPQQQVALLQSRGIKISDSGTAEKFLCYHISIIKPRDMGLAG